MTSPNDDRLREWLEADGRGGFASGTVAGMRTRRYHAWLLSAERDGSRFVLVNGGNVIVETAAGSWPLSIQEYAGASPQVDGIVTPFVDAWIRVRGGTAGAREGARQRFIPPLEAHLQQGGLGHVSEVASAEAPHDIGGCPFQAWSLGELLRLELVSLRLASREVDLPALAIAP